MQTIEMETDIDKSLATTTWNSLNTTWITSESGATSVNTLSTGVKAHQSSNTSALELASQNTASTDTGVSPKLKQIPVSPW